jgi:hypothetical protein
MMIDGADSGAAGAVAPDGAPGSAEALLPDALESAVQEKIAKIAIRLMVDAAINNTLTPLWVNFFRASGIASRWCLRFGDTVTPIPT